jgi:hypothetical protein
MNIDSNKIYNKERSPPGEARKRLCHRNIGEKNGVSRRVLLP